MSRMIFVNLPTADLSASDRFYEALGFTKNAMFSNENASAWMVSDAIFVMILREEFFASFLTGQDTPVTGSSHKETLTALSAETRDDVGGFLAAAVAGGGAIYREQDEPMPGMVQGAVADPDGHVWEIAWMDPQGISAP